MTDEPVYTFIKGQGWVIKPPCEVVEATAGYYKITLECRNPEPGERWVRCTRHKTAADHWEKCMRIHWNWRYDERYERQSPLLTQISAAYDKYSPEAHANYTIFTINVERIR